jgi:hypothetical protein
MRGSAATSSGCTGWPRRRSTASMQASCATAITSAYGAVYVVFHDGLVHRRVPMPRPATRNLRRIVQAHPLHHAVRSREGALSFAFLHAPDPRALRHYVRRRRAVARADGRRDEREEPDACRS